VAIWAGLVLFGMSASGQYVFPYGLVSFRNLNPDRPVYFLEEGTLAKDFFAQVLAGPVGATLAPIPQVGSQVPYVATDVIPGYFDGGDGYVPGVDPRGLADFAVRVWKGATNYDDAPFRGQSARWNQATGFELLGGIPPVVANLEIPAPIILTAGLPANQALASASVSKGVITAVTVTQAGGDYASAPTVSIVGGGGTGAIATAILTNGAVSQVVVSNPGSNYTSNPSVVIGPPFGFATGLLAWWRGEGNADDDLGFHPGQ
jgi:hypothetical protein